MEEDFVYKKLLRARTRQFDNNIESGLINQYNSPIFDALKVALTFGIYEETIRLIFGLRVYSKQAWKGLVWAKAWGIEDADWRLRCAYFKSLSYIKMLMHTPQYCIWWQISDKNTNVIKECEIMVQLICRVSGLRCDDYRLRNAPFGMKSCLLCDDLALEDPKHIILQCSHLADERKTMFDELENIPNGTGTIIMNSSENLLCTMIGKPVDGVMWPDMVNFWIIVATHVYKMYRKVIRDRAGIG